MSLLAAMNVLTIVVVLLIQVVYDVLWGPDPNRFGFCTNFLYGSILIMVHLAIATWIIRLARALGARTPRSSNA